MLNIPFLCGQCTYRYIAAWKMSRCDSQTGMLLMCPAKGRNQVVVRKSVCGERGVSKTDCSFVCLNFTCEA